MAEIEIIAIPSGRAPLNIRQQWVGMILPVAENLPFDNIIEGNVQGGGILKNLRGFPVESIVAIKELAKKSPETADWWKLNFGFTGRNSWLFFQSEVCRLV